MKISPAWGIVVESLVFRAVTVQEGAVVANRERCPPASGSAFRRTLGHLV
jgi:hypothetical protein